MYYKSFLWVVAMVTVQDILHGAMAHSATAQSASAVASGSMDYRLLAQQPTSQKFYRPIGAATLNGVEEVYFSPDEKYLVAVPDDLDERKVIWLIEIQAKDSRAFKIKVPLTLLQNAKGISFFAVRSGSFIDFSPDGHMVVATVDDPELFAQQVCVYEKYKEHTEDRICIWSTKTGHTYEHGHEIRRVVVSVRFSPDNRHIAVELLAMRYSKGKQYAPELSREIMVYDLLHKHSYTVPLSLALKGIPEDSRERYWFSVDGKLHVTHNYDGTPGAYINSEEYIFDVDTGKQQTVELTAVNLSGEASHITAEFRSPSGRYIAVAQRGLLVLYTVLPEWLEKILENSVKIPDAGVVTPSRIMTINKWMHNLQPGMVLLADGLLTYNKHPLARLNYSDMVALWNAAAGYESLVWPHVAFSKSKDVSSSSSSSSVSSSAATESAMQRVSPIEDKKRKSGGLEESLPAASNSAMQIDEGAQEKKAAVDVQDRLGKKSRTEMRGAEASGSSLASGDVSSDDVVMGESDSSSSTMPTVAMDVE